MNEAETKMLTVPRPEKGRFWRSSFLETSSPLSLILDIKYGVH